MDYMIRFAHVWTLYYIVPLLALIIAIKYWFSAKAYYLYPVTESIARTKSAKGSLHKKALFAIRVITLGLLTFLIAKPQLVDTHSNVIIDGIDIMLVLDVSGSMQFQDYDDDQRSRLDVAKDEALCFVNKRTSDAIGLVIFAKDALSRIPLTLDKKVINSLIKELHIGILEPDGTVLSTAIITAANRLKKSTAKSKIMIVLTDGAPSQTDVDPALAIELSQKLGIKIYTVGIGSDENQFFTHPLYGIVPKPCINRQLLQKIAQETGGKFFLARNSKDMHAIYQTIDTLEKTAHETRLFSKYFDIFVPFVWILIMLLCVELIALTTIWFGI